jgi:hypothetical protein
MGTVGMDADLVQLFEKVLLDARRRRHSSAGPEHLLGLKQRVRS